MDLPIVLAIAGLVSCGYGKPRPEKPARGAFSNRSPYEKYLPQSPPAETNRVRFRKGISMVSPPGWKSRTIPIESFLKGYVTDEFVLEGEADPKEEYKPKITIQSLGPKARHQWETLLKREPGRKNLDRYVLTRFQGEPAFARFLSGFGESHAVRGSYQPWLLQGVVFKSQGQWFSLDFDVRNADEGEPYYTEPLKIIQDYFETFRYNPSAD
jgi:hypothetical protein